MTDSMIDLAAPQSSTASAMRQVAIYLLLFGGLIGLIGAFLPWFVFASSDYHAEPRLIDGLMSGWLLPVATFMIIGAGVLGFGAAAGLRVGIENRYLIVSSLILASVSLRGIVGVDVLSYYFQLDPPFIAPTPGIGQLVTVAGLVAVAIGSAVWLPRQK